MQLLVPHHHAVRGLLVCCAPTSFLYVPVCNIANTCRVSRQTSSFSLKQPDPSSLTGDHRRIFCATCVCRRQILCVPSMLYLVFLQLLWFKKSIGCRCVVSSLEHLFLDTQALAYKMANDDIPTFATSVLSNDFTLSATLLIAVKFVCSSCSFKSVPLLLREGFLPSPM